MKASKAGLAAFSALLALLLVGGLAGLASAHFTVHPREVAVHTNQEFIINIHSHGGLTVKAELLLPPSFVFTGELVKDGWKATVQKLDEGGTLITWEALAPEEGIPDMAYDVFGVTAVPTEVGTYTWVIRNFFVPGAGAEPRTAEGLESVELKFEVHVREKPLLEELDAKVKELGDTNQRVAQVINLLEQRLTELEQQRLSELSSKAESSMAFGLGGIAAGVVGAAIGTLSIARSRRAQKQ